MTYLIAQLSYKIGGLRPARARSVSAAAVGTAVAVCYPFIKNDLLLFIVKTVLYIVLCMILYLGKKKKYLPFVFLAVTAGVGGAVFFIGFAICGNVEAAMRGAYDFSPGLIIAGGGCVYALAVRIKMRLTRKVTLKNFICNVTIFLRDLKICVKGIIDSGNCVYDAKSCLPVMFLFYEIDRSAFGKTSTCLQNGNFYGYTEIVDVNGQKRRVPLIRPDKIEIDCGNVVCLTGEEILLGIMERRKLDNVEYGAILHPAMLKGGNNETH